VVVYKVTKLLYEDAWDNVLLLPFSLWIKRVTLLSLLKTLMGGGGGGGDNQDEFGRDDVFECDNWFVFKNRGGDGIGTLPRIIVGRCGSMAVA
jgi:hypothetical protein